MFVPVPFLLKHTVYSAATIKQHNGQNEDTMKIYFSMNRKQNTQQFIPPIDKCNAQKNTAYRNIVTA